MEGRKMLTPEWTEAWIDYLGKKGFWGEEVTLILDVEL